MRRYHLVMIEIDRSIKDEQMRYVIIACEILVVYSMMRMIIGDRTGTRKETGNDDDRVSSFNIDQ